MIPVVLDCDTGTDDAVAIICAALHPDVELLGVGTVWGNHDVRHTTDNTLRVLDLLGAHHVPVVPGLAGPFRGRVTPLPSGRADLPATLDLPPSRRPAHDATAPDWLAATVLGHPGPVTVVTTGPLSNLAAAVERHPSVVERVSRVVCLAGTHEEAGVHPRVERNVWCDPEAADLVVAAGFADLTFVGMDATFSAPLTRADATALRALDTPVALVVADLVDERIDWYARDAAMSALGAAPLHDPMALAHVVAPGLVATRPAAARVDLTDGPTYGRTVYDLAGEHPTLRVGLGADHDGYVEWLLLALLGGSEPR